jgi:hypothetical protein
MHNASSPSCTPRSCGSSPLQDRSPTKKWPQMFSTSSGHIASCAQAALQLLPSPSPTLRIRCHIRGYSRYRHWHRRGRRLQLWCHSQPSLRERRKRRTAIAQLGPDAFLPVSSLHSGMTNNLVFTRTSTGRTRLQSPCEGHNMFSLACQKGARLSTLRRPLRFSLSPLLPGDISPDRPHSSSLSLSLSCLLLLIRISIIRQARCATGGNRER